MRRHLKVFNTYTRRLEDFIPLNPPHVGLYLCGPTVYSAPHLGHARSAITFDVIVRYLRHIDYKVRYVRNITDVGHLVGDEDEGEDKIIKQAKLSQVAPMEIAQQYTDKYHYCLTQLGVLLPSIEPSATGHITEQIELIARLIEKGFAYVVNSSVYFDLKLYQQHHPYGILSGKKIPHLRTNTRTLTHKVAEKKNPHDFALWKKAPADHLMRWPSPWGVGFPGWHVECTAMSEKYLGSQFDIHGGGLDLCFPHHECEIAQATAVYGHPPARYWIHNNMVTIHGQKMSKSANNSIPLQACFSGKHPLLTQPFSPMVLRFFMLQAHYRSTLSFSNKALQAAKKGYYKLINTLLTLDKIEHTYHTDTPHASTISQGLVEAIKNHIAQCYAAMDEDFNTAKALTHLFELRKIVNQIYSDSLIPSDLGHDTFKKLKTTYSTFLQEILGLKENHKIDVHYLIDLLIDQYTVAKKKQDYTTVDAIRTALKTQGISVQDTPKSIDWSYDPK